METTSFLLSINTRWWNAEAHYAFNLGLALAEQGHQVTFLANPGSPVALKAASQGFVVVDSILLDDAKPWVQWGNLARLRKVVQDRTIACVVSFKSSGSWVFGALRTSVAGLTHIRVRGEARAPKQNVFNRWLYGPNSCDGILCSGKQVQRWVEDLGEDLPPRQVLHFGAPTLENTGEINPLEFKPKGPVICLLGRSQPVKGHLVCLDAFKALGREDATLLFLIKNLAEFPEQLQLMQQKIQDLGLDSQVVITGPIPNLQALLSQVDLGVIPSLGSEVNCRVLVEFFSQKIPVVASSVGTLPDLIQTQQNGWLCEELNVETLTQGMEQGLLHFQMWGENAYNDYETLYRLEPFANQFLDFFAKIRRH